MTPLERLQSSYYNSSPVSEANPGGLGGGGHTLNFPAALADLSAVASSIDFLDALAQVNALAAAAAASADTAEMIAGFDVPTYEARVRALEATDWFLQRRR